MIRVLDKKTADKIAAGEVVDRPASIVKELVENSIDSGATAVTIEIKKGGKEYIRVTDNGSGITYDDAELAFKRHATSKIQSEKDLLSIGTLGFRGEALASICAVSRIELITKVKDSRVGRRIIVEGSEILSNTPTGCPEGTTVTVKDLFYNVPARRKFLGSDGIETRRIIDLASRIALSYPDVRFTVINSSNRVFSTSGRGNILESIISIYGTDIGKDLIPVERTLEKGEERYILKGFVSNPGNTLSNRNRQIFCVNGRVVSSKTIERGIDKAYKERVFAGRFPIAFIFISVPSKRLDVNIHPTKKEIRFDDNALIEDFVWETIASGLVGDESIASFSLSEKNLVKATEVEEIIEKRKIQDNSEQVQLNFESQSPKVVAENTFQYEKTEENTSDREEVDIKHLLTILREEQEKETEDREKLVKKLEISKPAKIPFEIGELEIVGSIFNTYIACQLRDSFYLIDQHAAHERVFYEKLVEQYNNDDKLEQTMLMPLNFSVSSDVCSAEELWIEEVRRLGYDVEFFGLNNYIVRGIPAFMSMTEAEEFLKDLFNELSDKPDMTNQRTLDRIITRSCKSAVKAGDNLKSLEIDELLSQLKQCKNPFSCPHGRPTFVKMTKYEIERMFKRV